MVHTIAITGATGFAGRHAVSELLKRGHRLKALVRAPGSAELGADVELVKGDLESRAALDELVAGADAVVHLAGAIAALDAPGFFRVNAKGTAALAEAAARAGTRRFVHISSLAAREPGLSPYGASKRAGEEAVLQLMERLNAIIIRPPAVYGPGDRGTLPLIRELTRPVALIPGRRAARFSLIHARDLARLIADSVVGNEQGVQEVAGGQEGGYGWTDLIRAATALRGRPVRAVFLPRAVPLAVALGAELMARISGRPGMVTRGKIAELYHPDWVARPGMLKLADPIPLPEGLAETVSWYRAAGWLPPLAGADTTNQISGT